jgi:hypothetical protein
MLEAYYDWNRMSTRKIVQRGAVGAASICSFVEFVWGGHQEGGGAINKDPAPSAHRQAGRPIALNEKPHRSAPKTFEDYPMRLAPGWGWSPASGCLIEPNTDPQLAGSASNFPT